MDGRAAAAEQLGRAGPVRGIGADTSWTGAQPLANAFHTETGTAH